MENNTQNYTIDGQYLTYQEYQSLGGTLTESSFQLLEFEARQIIDKYTFGRLKNLSEQIQEVKLCVLKLISMVDSYNALETQNKGVSSENTDGYSISYSTITIDVIRAKNDEYEDVVKTYLADCKLEDGTPYLYRGAE